MWNSLLWLKETIPLLCQSLETLPRLDDLFLKASTLKLIHNHWWRWPTLGRRHGSELLRGKTMQGRGAHRDNAPWKTPEMLQYGGGQEWDEVKNNEGKLDVYVTSVDLPPPSPPSELHYRKYFRQPRPEVHSLGKLKGGETANLETQSSVQHRSRLRDELVHSVWK